MLAALFDAIGKPLRIGELAIPKPAAEQVLIKIRRCGICGSDLHMTAEPVFGVARDDVLGHEFSGEVLEVGAGVEGLKTGDRVTVAPLPGCGDCEACRRGEPAWCAAMALIGGGYAQYAAVAGRQCRKLPWGVDLADGALAEPLAVALHAVMQAEMRPGERVLVVGAGAIGLSVAFWARRSGAGEVIVTDLHRFQEDRAMALGASALVVSDAELSKAVLDRWGVGPDIVLECVGKVGLIDHCIGLVRPRGKVIGVGLCTTRDHLDMFRAISKGVKIIMSAFFNMHEFRAAIDTLGAGRFAPQALVTETISLTALPQAFEALRQRTAQCKVLVDPFATDMPASAS